MAVETATRTVTVTAAEYWELLAAAQALLLARHEAQALVTRTQQAQTTLLDRLADRYGFSATTPLAVNPRDGQPPDAPYTITVMDEEGTAP